MQKQQKDKQIDYTKMLSECQSNSPAYDHLYEKVRMTNQQIISRVNVKKVEQHCMKKLDSKQREMLNQICSQMREKLQSMVQRETKNLLTKWRTNENLKVVDYIRERKNVMEGMGEKFEDWYDEEEHYLEDLEGFLLDYYKKM